MTVKLVYSGPEPVYVADAHLIVEPGKPTNVPAEVAAGLLLQPLWRKAPQPKGE